MNIYTSNGTCIKIDDDDFEKVKDKNWCINSRGYAVTTLFTRGSTRLMHRIIMGINDPKVLIDHKDRDRLNNSKSNLRICNASENQKNKKPSGEVKFLGVSIHRSKGLYKLKSGEVKTHYRKDKFIAHINVNGKAKHLGLFTCEIEAAKCYDEAAKKYHGEFANLNFKP